MNLRNLPPGLPAPDFTLPSTKGSISLSELLKTKSVVLAFYADDQAPECRGELNLFKEEYSVLEFLEAEVVGIGVDTLKSHKAFLQEFGSLPYPLVSDRGRTLGKAYGVLDETGKRYRQAVYVISRWGNVTLAMPEFQLGDQDQYLEILQALGLNIMDS